MSSEEQRYLSRPTRSSGSKKKIESRSSNPKTIKNNGMTSDKDRKYNPISSLLKSNKNKNIQNNNRPIRLPKHSEQQQQQQSIQPKQNKKHNPISRLSKTNKNQNSQTNKRPIRVQKQSQQQQQEQPVQPTQKLSESQRQKQSLKCLAIIFLSCFTLFTAIGICTYSYNVATENHKIHEQMTSIYKKMYESKFDKDKLIQDEVRKCDIKIAEENVKCKRYQQINSQANAQINNPEFSEQKISQRRQAFVQQPSPLGKGFEGLVDLSPPKKKPGPVARTPGYFPSATELQPLTAINDLIIVTHAGRRAYLQILFKHLSLQKDYFFQWHLWVRTQIKADIQYMQALQRQNAWIRLIRLNPPKHPSVSMMYFYKHDCQQKKVYLKLDDDILWMDSDFVKKMFDHRFKLVEYLLVFPNIINTGIHAHLQQRSGIFKYPELVDYNCNGNLWKKPMIGVNLHKQFIESIKKSQVDKWRKCFTKWQLIDYERVSINAIIYYSQTIRSLQFIQSRDDQYTYTQVYTKMYDKPTVIVGDTLCVHQAFMTQRRYFNQNHPQIYEQYKKIAEKL